MAGRTITQRIALDGGAEIKAQLEQIGAAGKAAFDRLSTAANQSAAFTKLGDSVAVLGTRFRALGASASGVNDNMNAVGSAVRNTSRSISVIGLAVGGAVAGLSALFKSAGDAQEQLQNTADLLGVTTEKYQAYRDAAELSGVDNGVFDKSVLKLVNTMRQASDGTQAYQKQVTQLGRDLQRGDINFENYSKRLQKLNDTQRDSTNVFKDLGVTITDVNGNLRDPLETLNDIASAFTRLPEGADKAAKSMQLFGNRNAKFGAFVNQGAAGIADLSLAAHRLAPALDKVGSAALDRASDSFTKLGKASKATGLQILAVFAPNASALVEAYTGVVVRARAAWVAYARTIEAQVKPIVEDIVAVLDGRDADVKNSFILETRDAFVQFGKDARNAVINIVIPALKGLLGVLQSVADAVNGIFGTKLTGGQIAIALIIGRVTGLLTVFTTTARLAGSAVMILFRSMSVLTGSIGVLARVIGVVVAAFGAVPLAIAAVGFAIGFLVVSIVQKFGGVTAIIARVQSAFAAFGAFIQGVAASIGTFFSNAWAGLTNGVAAFVASVIAWFARIPQSLGIIFAGVSSIANAAWQAIVTGAAALWQALVDGFNGTINTIIAFFTVTLPAAFDKAFQALVGFVAKAWEAMKQGAADAVNWIVNGFKAGVDKITGFFTGLLTRALEIFKSIIAGANAVKAAASGASGGDAKKPSGFASGGHVRGPGSGRSDSIWARISNGEFVQQFSAVRKYGVAFMNALNQGRISAGRVRDLMSGMDFGGAAQNMGASLMPAVPRTHFATGGLVATGAGNGNLHPVNVNIGGQSFQMAAAPDVVGQLQRYAAGKSIRSAGRAPNWVR